MPSYAPRETRTNRPNIPDLFDDRYSSDESDARSSTGRERSREPPSSSEWRGEVPRQAPLLDPPDENRYDGRGGQRNHYNNRAQDADRSHYDHGRAANNNQATRGKSPRSTNDTARGIQGTNHGKKTVRRNSSKLLDDEEELYEQYQDELFHQQPLFAQQQQTMSSHYGQFNITPLVEMTPMNGGKSKKQKQKHKSTRESKSRGRYSQLDHNEDDVEESIDRILDTLPGTQQQQKTHKEFYNLDSDGSDSEDDDEERPLRKSRSSSSLNIQRLTSTSSRWENCLNRTLVTLIALLSFIFIRDHTPWWKNYQSRIAMEKYENEHVQDPMKVYNSADDDSTHARDHDPTNVYNKVSAGERISDRPAKKR
jgi:hypothetical protein